MKNLSNTEPELKKVISYEKACTKKPIGYQLSANKQKKSSKLT